MENIGLVTGIRIHNRKPDITHVPPYHWNGDGNRIRRMKQTVRVNTKQFEKHEESVSEIKRWQRKLKSENC